MSEFELPLSVVLGVGLAAATGFRVFLPMLVVSAAHYFGHLPLSDSFAWLGTGPALTMLSVATLVEILAYYIPGLDNLLDTLATPAALVAGTVVSAAVMTDVTPMVKWTAAIIAGGGVAGLTQVISTAELVGALVVSLLALAAPLAALAVVILFLWLMLRLVRHLFRGGPQSNIQK
jgi:hypothetical protein